MNQPSIVALVRPKEDWDQYRAEITRLYRTEKKTLKQVSDYMIQHYQFKATEKQYKIRIKQWELDKKNKKHEVEAILHQTHMRSRVGKKTEIILRGQRVDMADIKRSARRMKVNLSSIDFSDERFAQALETLICFTPPPSPYLVPQLSYRPLKFLRDLQALVEGSCSQKDALSKRIWARVDVNSSNLHIELFGFLSQGTESHISGRNDLAFACWRRAFRNLELVLNSWNKDTLIGLFRVLLHVEASQIPDVAQLLSTQLRALGTRIFPEDDPRRSIVESFPQTLFDTRQAWICLLDLLEKHSAASDDLFYEKVSFAEAALERDSVTAIDDYLPKIEELDVKYGPHDGRTMFALLQRAGVLLRRKDFWGVDAIATAMTERAWSMRFCKLGMWYKCKSSLFTAAVQNFYGLHERARMSAKISLMQNETYERTYGGPILATNERLYSMEILVESARALGDEEDAAAWQARIDEINSTVLAEDAAVIQDLLSS